MSSIFNKYRKKNIAYNNNDSKCKSNIEDILNDKDLNEHNEYEDKYLNHNNNTMDNYFVFNEEAYTYNKQTSNTVTNDLNCEDDFDDVINNINKLKSDINIDPILNYSKLDEVILNDDTNIQSIKNNIDVNDNKQMNECDNEFEHLTDSNSLNSDTKDLINKIKKSKNIDNTDINNINQDYKKLTSNINKLFTINETNNSNTNTLNENNNCNISDSNSSSDNSDISNEFNNIKIKHGLAGNNSNLKSNYNYNINKQDNSSNEEFINTYKEKKLESIKNMFINNELYSLLNKAKKGIDLYNEYSIDNLKSQLNNIDEEIKDTETAIKNLKDEKEIIDYENNIEKTTSKLDNYLSQSNKIAKILEYISQNKSKETINLDNIYYKDNDKTNIDLNDVHLYVSD